MSQELGELCNKLRQHDFPEDYKSCLQASATLIDQAAECLPSPEMDRMITALLKISMTVDDLATKFEVHQLEARQNNDRNGKT